MALGDWHGQHDQISLLQTIRRALADIQRTNHGAAECRPEQVDPHIDCGAIFACD
jgi:hypothetical protein